MKTKITIILLIALSFTSCNLIKSPEFQGINRVYFKQNKNGNTVLTADAKFHNPNLLGGKFQLNEVKVYTDNKLFGNLNSDTYKVPSKKDFIIPMEIDFNKDFFTKNNVLDVLNNLVKNNLKVKYEGKIYYISGKIKIPYKINHEQEIKIIKDK